MRWLFATLCMLLAIAGCGQGERLHEDERAGDHAHATATPGKEGVVVISPQAIERSGIELAVVGKKILAGGIDVPAEVRAEPDRTAHVSPLLSGQLASVEASIGDQVEAGDVLASLRSVKLGTSRSALARARANVEVAQSSFDRQQELQREGIGARREFLEAQADLRRAKAELSAATRALTVYGRGGSGSKIPLRSPIAGEIVQRHATVGEVVGPEDVLFEVTDIRRVWVVGRAYQQHAGDIRVGARAVLTLPAYPGRSWTSEIDYVAPALDEDTRTLPVRVVLDNPEKLLRPGLFGTLSISPAGRGNRSVPVVRADAVQTLDGQTVVFVPGEKAGEFHVRAIALGDRAGGRVHVISGLAPGDRYVARGGFVLKSELLRGQLGEGHAH